MDELFEKIQTTFLQLQQCCEQERDALRHNQAETLLAQTEIKARLLDSLITLDSNHPNLKQDMETLKTHPQYSQLKDLMTDCAKQNLQNGQLISALQSQNNGLWRILRGESVDEVLSQPQQTLYDGSGKKEELFSSNLELTG